MQTTGNSSKVYELNAQGRAFINDIFKQQIE